MSRLITWELGTFLIDQKPIVVIFWSTDLVNLEMNRLIHNIFSWKNKLDGGCIKVDKKCRSQVFEILGYSEMIQWIVFMLKYLKWEYLPTSCVICLQPLRKYSDCLDLVSRTFSIIHHMVMLYISKYWQSIHVVT